MEKLTLKKVNTELARRGIAATLEFERTGGNHFIVTGEGWTDTIHYSNVNELSMARWIETVQYFVNREKARTDKTGLRGTA